MFKTYQEGELLLAIGRLAEELGLIRPSAYIKSTWDAEDLQIRERWVSKLVNDHLQEPVSGQASTSRLERIAYLQLLVPFQISFGQANSS